MSTYQQPYEAREAYDPYTKERRHSVDGGTGGPAEQALHASPPWNDKLWAVAFWLQLIALLVVGFLCYRQWQGEFDATNKRGQGQDSVGPLEHAFPLIGVCVGVAVAQAFVWMYLMKNHGVFLIWTSLVFGLFISGAIVILCVLQGNLYGVIFGGLMFLLNLWYVYSVRHKIPFAAAMLDVSLRSMSMFPSAWLLPILGMVLMSALAFLWMVCAMSIVYAVDHGTSEGPRSVRGLIFFLLALSLFWTILCVKSWVHVCVAGVQATWYFLAPHAVPAHPVYQSIKRASTTSFGSICFGSFIVAFIRTVRFMVQIAYNNARESNNAIAACALCCLECLIGILESIVNYVNQYAFAICAIYGKAFIPAAKEAWGLMRSRGYDAVINDSLIGSVFQFAQIIGGLLVGVVSALVALYVFNTDWRSWAGIGFVTGVMLMVVITEVAESAIITLFICLADDPVSLQRSKPDAYNRLMDPLNENYPARGQPGLGMGGHV